jgi:hypothetical protein
MCNNVCMAINHHKGVGVRTETEITDSVRADIVTLVNGFGPEGVKFDDAVNMVADKLAIEPAKITEVYLAQSGFERPTSNRIVFSNREYEREHGKAPRGYGNWAFAELEDGDFGPYVFFQGTLTEAKVQARKHFGSLGASYVAVLP